MYRLTSAEWLLCVGRQNSGAFGFALIFWLHFLHQGKKWKSNYDSTIKKIKVNAKGQRCNLSTALKVTPSAQRAACKFENAFGRFLPAVEMTSS
jgi:hypothetical protein